MKRTDGSPEVSFVSLAEKVCVEKVSKYSTMSRKNISVFSKYL